MRQQKDGRYQKMRAEAIDLSDGQALPYPEQDGGSDLDGDHSEEASSTLDEDEFLLGK